MAPPKTLRRSIVDSTSLRSQSNRKVKVGRMAQKGAAISRKNVEPMTESDNDANDDDSDASHEKENGHGDQSGDDEEKDVQALSGAYPFEFDNDDRLTGTSDEEMATPGSEMPDISAQILGRSHTVTPLKHKFEESMDLADVACSPGTSDSDGEAYNGIEAVSEDDDDDNDDDDDEDDLKGDESEDDILREAERDLIAEFEEAEDVRTMLPFGEESLASAEMDQLERCRISSLASSNNDPFSALPVNMNADPFKGATFMDSTWGSLWENAELSIWRKPPNEQDQQNTKQKRVRFQDSAVIAHSSSGSSSDSSDDEEEEENTEQFPDIFVDRTDPKIQRLMSRDTEVEWNGLVTDASDGESAYDFEDDADRFAFEMDEESNSSGSDDSSESDDDGDETEDESVEEQQAKMQQFRRALRQAGVASTPGTPTGGTSARTPPSKKTAHGRRNSILRLGRGPRQGTFICDPTKATLTTDKSTRKTILYPPVQPSAQHKAFWDRARSAANNQDDSPRGSIAVPTRASDESPERPFTARTTLSSLFDGRIDILDDSKLPTLGAPQPFPSFQNTVSSFASVTDDASDMEAEYPTDFDTMLNMENFEDDSSDTDMATPGTMTPREPAFLSQGVVGSFRLNQHRAKHESSLESHPAKRASTAEQNALQSGRRAAGNAPITPARKRRTSSQDLRRTGSGIKKSAAPVHSSPLTARRRHSRGQSLSGRLDQTLTPEMWKKM